MTLQRGRQFFFFSNILTLTIPVLYVILCGFRCTSGILACGALLNPTFCRKVRSMCGLIARPYIVQMDVTTCQSPKLRFATLYKGIDRVTKTKLRFFPQKCKSLVGKGFYCRPPRGQLTKKALLLFFFLLRPFAVSSKQKHFAMCTLFGRQLQTF